MTSLSHRISRAENLRIALHSDRLVSLRQLQAVIADHKQLREAHHESLTHIIDNQNETALKLAVCLDRNTAALQECALELRLFREHQ